MCTTGEPHNQLSRNDALLPSDETNVVDVSLTLHLSTIMRGAHELLTSGRDLISHPADGHWGKIAPIRTLSVDIECAGRKVRTVSSASLASVRIDICRRASCRYDRSVCYVACTYGLWAHRSDLKVLVPSHAAAGVLVSRELSTCNVLDPHGCLLACRGTFRRRRRTRSSR